jgi:membrane protein
MKKLFLLAKRTFQEYGDDNCSLLAAAISYYVLFSVVPLTIFLASIFGFVMRNETARQDVVNHIVQSTPLEQGSGTNLVTDTINGVSRVSAPLTVVGLVGLAWSASSMFSAIRRGLNIAFDVEKKRPVVQQKLIDLGMIAGLGLILIISVVGTGFLRILREVSSDRLGPLSTSTSFFWQVLPFLVPAVFSFLLFLLVYRFVPVAGLKFRDVWPGALLAAVLFEMVKNAFAIYIANFGNYDLAYGALGGVLIFLLWTYITANILLVGAELASEYPRVRAGLYDEPGGPGRSLKEQALRSVKGLFVRQEPGAETPQARRKR